MPAREPEFGEPEYHRRFMISYMCDAALDPQEALERATMDGRPVHPTILLDTIDEVEYHYTRGWKEFFDDRERAAIERFIDFVNRMTPIEDEAWAPPTADGPLWAALREEARALILALGGLPENYPGNWAR